MEIISGKDMTLLGKINIVSQTVSDQINAINIKYNGKFKSIMCEEIEMEEKVVKLKKLKNQLVKERTQSDLSNSLKSMKTILASGTKGLNSIIKEYDECVKEMEAAILEPVKEFEEAKELEIAAIAETVTTLTSYIDALTNHTATKDEVHRMMDYINIEVSDEHAKLPNVDQLMRAVNTLATGFLSVAALKEETNGIKPPVALVDDIIDFAKPQVKPSDQMEEEMYEAIYARAIGASRKQIAKQFKEALESKKVHGSYVLLSDAVIEIINVMNEI